MIAWMIRRRPMQFVEVRAWYSYDGGWTPSHARMEATSFEAGRNLLPRGLAWAASDTAGEVETEWWTDPTILTG